MLDSILGLWVSQGKVGATHHRLIPVDEWGDAQAEDNEDAIMTPTVNAEEANTCHSQHESVGKGDATIDPTSNATGHNKSAVVVQVKYRFCFFVKHLASSE